MFEKNVRLHKLDMLSEFNFVDNWLQGENESEKDIISRTEAEALTKLIGAVAYIETSAVEQTGLTECFTKAVNERLIRSDSIYTEPKK